MTMANFSVCLVLVLYQLSVAFSNEASSELSDLGLTDPKVEKDAEGVRCYCNTAQCVSTGYMCRSRKGGGCYSELPPRRHHSRHGCLHHLAEREEDALSHCQNAPSSGGPPPREYSLLLCCFKDLCNHEDSPLARARLNLTATDSEGNTVASERGASYNGEVWFKAATIAVPVCGALILFLLVAVAVRLLRADALLHADRKLRGGYITPPQHNTEDVKKVWVGNSAPLLVAPGGCLVAVERAQLVDVPQLCDIQR
ncbi:BMP and activin membrane-bound inhibitor homolog isoform X1 [Pieris brassicae]|uniref:BMP and activin membrane-bound inhibitor homolog isoform X1 n=1 Tax=Pieris brassicae TaxID=7116 RepID=UPI001E65ED2D|nr:BMP and activin membrane-bound inhibitor homolog isoform X1 [Pieris brassicae]